MEKINVGFCITGSYCTFSNVIKELNTLVDAGYNVIPIVSYNVKNTDTRFYIAETFLADIQKITGNTVIDSIVSAEPIGPTKQFDVLVVAPATGNTLSKLASGITDTPVTMAVKAHLRNNLPVVIAVSTNDGLSTSAQNIGRLMAIKNYFFVPFRQDDCIKKPKSLVADFGKIAKCIELALKGEQLQPTIF